MNFLDTFADIGCFFTNIYMALLILSTLIYFKKYEIFYSMTILLGTSGLLNGVLKAFFKVPLLPHLGFGYAFPSGHSQSCMILWGWLCINQLVKKSTAIIIIIFAGYSLYFKDYHLPNEILAGYATGMILILTFYRSSILKHLEWLLLFNCLLMLDILKQDYLIFAYLPFFIISSVFIIYKLVRA